jgi:hypothetical protein
MHTKRKVMIAGASVGLTLAGLGAGLASMGAPALAQTPAPPAVSTPADPATAEAPGTEVPDATEAAGEAPGGTEVADANEPAGGHEDPPGNVDHQFEGVE